MVTVTWLLLRGYLPDKCFVPGQVLCAAVHVQHIEHAEHVGRHEQQEKHECVQPVPHAPPFHAHLLEVPAPVVASESASTCSEASSAPSCSLTNRWTVRRCHDRSADFCNKLSSAELMSQAS